MKPTLKEAIEQLKVTSDPPERLQRRLENLATTPTERRSRGRDWLAVGAVGAAIAGLTFAAMRLSITPPVEPPVSYSSTKPSAQSTLQEAYQKIITGRKEKRFRPIGSEIREGKLWQPPPKPVEVRARREIVESYRESLALMHRAMSEPFYPLYKDIYVVNDYSGKNSAECYFGATGLLKIEVIAKADKGDIEGALKEALDIVALGAKLEQNAQFRDWQAANLVKMMGLQALKYLLPALNAVQAQKAAHQLERLEAKRAPLKLMFQATRWAAYKTFQTKSWDQCMFDFVISYGPRSTMALKATPKAWIIAEHLRYLEALGEYSSEPRRLEKPLPTAPKDAFNQYMKDRFDYVFTDDGLSRTSAALMIGLLRRKTDSQAPLPEDPFSPGKALQERSDGLIYSVGPDRVDNGGMPMKRTDGPGDIDINRLL